MTPEEEAEQRRLMARLVELEEAKLERQIAQRIASRRYIRWGIVAVILVIVIYYAYRQYMFNFCTNSVDVQRCLERYNL